MRDVDVPLAYIERQLPGRPGVELREQGVRTGGREYVWDVDATLGFEDFGDRPAVESGFSLIGACMSCRCTGKSYRPWLRKVAVGLLNRRCLCYNARPWRITLCSTSLT